MLVCQNADREEVDAPDQKGDRASFAAFAAFFSARSLNETDRARQSARIMPVDYDRNPQPDLGYSGWTQFDDGEIYVVN